VDINGIQVYGIESPKIRECSWDKKIQNRWKRGLCIGGVRGLIGPVVVRHTYEELICSPWIECVRFQYLPLPSGIVVIAIDDGMDRINGEPPPVKQWTWHLDRYERAEI
jgi:hypothetical protein